MKLAVNILLIVFVTFLSTPTIVSVIKKSTDTSYFYSMSEEELTHKEVKAEFKFETLNLVFSRHNFPASFHQKIYSSITKSLRLSSYRRPTRCNIIAFIQVPAMMREEPLYYISSKVL
jgi:hypothetical protein